MARISAATERALTAVAIRMVAENLSRNTPGLSGFSEQWRRDQTRAEREINAAFDAIVKRLYRELSTELKRENEAVSAASGASKVAESDG